MVPQLVLLLLAFGLPADARRIKRQQHQPTLIAEDTLVHGQQNQSTLPGEGTLVDDLGKVNAESLVGLYSLDLLVEIMQKNPTGKVYYSHQIQEYFGEFFKGIAPGLDVSYASVFEGLDAGGCSPYVVGGQVRDILYRKMGADVDIGFTCGLNDIEGICKAQSWPVKLKQSSQHMKIGKPGAKDPIEGKPISQSLLASSTSLEYTCNSLVFALRSNHIVDITGHGLKDLINHIIRIPGSRDTWEAWASGPGGDGVVKLLRAYKLRIKGFSWEADTKAFAKAKMIDLFETQREIFDVKVKDQLEHYLDGLTPAERQVRSGKLREKMIEDFGDEFYNLAFKSGEPADFVSFQKF